MIIYLSLAVILLGLVELLPLLKKKMIKESILVSVILSCSFITLLIEGLSMTSPLQILYNLVSPMAKLIFKA